MAILVIAEHDNNAVKPALLNTIAAASEIGDDIHVLVAGSQCASAAEMAARISGVTKVLVSDAAHYAHPIAENLAALIVPLADGYSHVLAPATSFGKNLLPRVAALLDVAQISDIVSVDSADTFVRPIYAGNALATVQSADRLKVITVRGTGFDAAPAEGGTATVETIDAGPDIGLTSLVSQELTKSARPELTAARVIVSGGRGMGNGENFAILEKLADKLGAAVGAVGVASTLPFIVLAIWVALFTVPIAGAFSQALWMRKIEPDIQGRVFAVRTAVASAAVPLSLILVGPLADRVFVPLMTGTSTLGLWLQGFFGTGLASAYGLFFVSVGLFVVASSTVAWSVGALRHLERDIPDAAGLPTEIDEEVVEATVQHEPQV